MLINIIFIIPYPELEEKVNKIFQNHPLRARLRKRIEMRTADELETFSFNAHSDVIIARGYTACGLRKMTPELPIIELPITAYDLIRALNECITLYSPKKVAFIGNYTALSEADELGNFVNCDIKSYHSESTDDITKAIDQAVADGYTAFIGGYSVNLICSQRRLPPSPYARAMRPLPGRWTRLCVPWMWSAWSVNVLQCSQPSPRQPWTGSCMWIYSRP